MAQVVECLLNKPRVLSLNSTTAPKEVPVNMILIFLPLFLQPCLFKQVSNLCCSAGVSIDSNFRPYVFPSRVEHKKCCFKYCPTRRFLLW
jgi:hypothetical protein